MNQLFKNIKSYFSFDPQATNWQFSYNNGPRTFYKENNIEFLDFEQDTLNQQTTVIDNRYQQANPSDNHLGTNIFYLLSSIACGV